MPQPLQSVPMRSTLLSPRWALALAIAGLLLELALILPILDKTAATNATVHFSQHGGVFLGGVLMGIALRDMFAHSRR